MFFIFVFISFQRGCQLSRRSFSVPRPPPNDRVPDVSSVRHTCTAGVISCWSRWDQGLCDGGENRTDASHVLWPQTRHSIHLYLSRLLCSEALLDASRYLNWWRADLDLIHSTQMFFIFLCDVIWICLLYLFKMLEVTQDSISARRITRPNLFSHAATVCSSSLSNSASQKHWACSVLV